MEADHAALQRIRASLQAEDYQLHVVVHDDTARVAITAGPAACADCLVGKDLMRVVLAPALGVPPGSIELTYPADPAV